jgi:Matrixin
VATSSTQRSIRGALAALVGVALAAGSVAVAGDADAYVVKKTSRGQLVHWESRDVDYTIAPSVEANVEGGAQATLHAMDSWSGSVGAPDLRTKVADAASPTKPGFDEKNGVFYMAGGYAPAGRALAITVLTYDNTTGRILDADVIFNGSYKFKVLEEGRLAEKAALRTASTDSISHEDELPAASVDTIYDLHHVIAHELGHSLGMNDEMERKDALMYRYTAPNDATLRAPASDDISGLAELYSTNLEAAGNGCGGAAVSPKKPGLAAQHAALVLAFGLLFFLALRARSDRRARFAFVLAAAAAAVTLMPSASKSGGTAQATEVAPGHARAKVLSAQTALEDGLMKTTFKLATTVCRATSCPKMGHGAAWGGTVGNITQEVGGQVAPQNGADVDVSFAKLPNALAPLASPLGVRDAAADDSEIRVVTAAR